MHVCRKCKERHFSAELDQARPFPAFTVTGGIAGMLAGALAGPLAVVAVPAGIIAGAAVDVSRCGLCGNQIGQGDQGFRLLNESDDGLGGRSYRLAAEPATGQEAMQALSPAKPPPAAKRQHSTAALRQPIEPDPFGHEGPRQGELTFDQVKGVFVPRDRPPESDVPLDASLPGVPDGPADPSTVEAVDTSSANPFDGPFFDPGNTEGSTFQGFNLDEPPPAEEPP
jgi:hypothetical protein